MHGHSACLLSSRISFVARSILFRSFVYVRSFSVLSFHLSVLPLLCSKLKGQQGR